MSARRKIFQIIPAEGWRAQFKAKQSDGGIQTRTLVCWALVESSGVENEREIVGVVLNDKAEIAFADQGEGFGGYAEALVKD
jgi:hypothetical protein